MILVLILILLILVILSISIHIDEVTDFYDKIIPKLDPNHTCLAVISLDSVLKKESNYYPQMLLIECKYTGKKVVSMFMSEFSYFLMSLMESKLTWSFYVSQLGIKHCKFCTLSMYNRYVY